MNSSLFINIAGGMAGLVLLRVFVIVIYTWLQTRWVKQNGAEATARILQMEVMNERSRQIPLVKLQLAITTVNGSTFIASVISPFHPSKWQQFTTNRTITVRYNPSNISQLQIVKEPQAVVKEHTPKWQPVSTKEYLSMVQ